MPAPRDAPAGEIPPGAPPPQLSLFLVARCAKRAAALRGDRGSQKQSFFAISAPALEILAATSPASLDLGQQTTHPTTKSANPRPTRGPQQPGASPRREVQPVP